MASVFISYTNRGGEPEGGREGEGLIWARRIAAWLREWGYESLFLDKDPNDGIAPGADWRGELISQLRRSRAVIAVCTPEYQRSPWCMAELGIALDRGKLLIPLQLGGPDVVPLLLQDKQAIQLDPLAFDASASDATTTTNAAAATTSTAATTATSCDDARLGLQRRLAEAISWQIGRAHV